ncbi:MAG: helix-turn-helix transcriptional regulator [Pseudolabrys sp.]|nr:helix-turn-helix transcriptional regulator [Pseudolabrys sp.]
MQSFESLIDRIYEAAVVPEYWTDILDRMAEIAGGEGSMLFATRPGQYDWIASEAIRRFTAEWIESEWVAKNARGQRLIPIREPRFLCDLDAFTREELDREPYYTEFLRPRGLGWCVGTAIHSPSSDTLVFSVERRHDAGPVERAAVDKLDALRPHLARAALLAGRAGLHSAQVSVDTLETVGFAAAVLTQTGRVLGSNPRFIACAPSISIGANNAVHFADPSAQKLFLNGLQSLQSGSGLSPGRSVPVPRSGTNPPLIAHLLPLRRSAKDIFANSYSLMFVTAVDFKKSPAATLLEGLFDLTPAEAKIASLVTEGLSVTDIAQSQMVSSNTVRMHLKAIFEKTGVHRQAELVSLMATPSSVP